MKDTRPLAVVRAAELTEPNPQKRWLVEQLWTNAGVGVIGGHPKCGKSWLGLDLALSIASGTKCLDSFAVVKAGPALIYMAEDAASTVKERLLGLCSHRKLRLETLPLFVITETTIRLDVDADQRRLREAVQQIQPKLLLLDPLVRCHRIDENDAGPVSGLLGFLRTLQREYDLAVAVVHHVRKNGPWTTLDFQIRDG